MKKYLIYALVDPISGEPQYVGKSCSGIVRPRQHSTPSALAHERNYAKGSWIRSLLKRGLKYSIAILYQADTEVNLCDAEIYWIAEMRRRGWSLTNISDGGEGWAVGSSHTPETRAKISAANKGRTCSEDHKKKNGDAHRGQDMSKACAASALKTKGAKRPPRSPEWCAKIAAAHKGKKLSQDHKDKLSEASRGRVHSEEAKKKITGRPKKAQ